MLPISERVPSRYQSETKHGFDISECKQQADLVIAIDGSGSIEKPNFYKMVDFVKELVEAVDVDSGTRVSMITYSTTATARLVRRKHLFPRLRSKATVIQSTTTATAQCTCTLGL